MTRLLTVVSIRHFVYSYNCIYQFNFEDFVVFTRYTVLKRGNLNFGLRVCKNIPTAI